MLITLAGVLTAVLVIFSITVAHELGHLVAGMTTGIPTDKMKIVIASVPPYVALQAPDGQWVGPNKYQSYMAAYQRFDPEGDALFQYIAGGLMFQTLFIVLVTAGSHVAPMSASITALFVQYSLIITSFYLVYDAAGTLYYKRPFADISAMYQLTRGKTLVVLAVFFGTHAALLQVFNLSPV